MDDKYITFKRKDWDEMIDNHHRVGARLNDFKAWTQVHELPDAVVIRRKDAFASAALHTYANSIGVAAKCIGMLSPDVSRRLLSIADYFHTQAVLSDDTDTKLPD